MNIKINKLTKETNNAFKQIAKKELKTNKKLRECTLDIKTHFKSKTAWPLGYEVYKEMSGVSALIWNQVLLLINMKIYFCKKRQEILFKKESK